MQDAQWGRDLVRDSVAAAQSIHQAPGGGSAPVDPPLPLGTQSASLSTLGEQRIPGDGEVSTQPRPDYTGPTGAIPMTEEYERVIVEHLPIVRFLARRIHERLPHQVDIEDLVSSGVLGLIDALQKFDPAKKVQFRSYAQFRIRGAILEDSLRSLDRSDRDLRRKGRSVEEAIRSLTAWPSSVGGRGGGRAGMELGGAPRRCSVN